MIVMSTITLPEGLELAEEESLAAEAAVARRRSLGWRLLGAIASGVAWLFGLLSLLIGLALLASVPIGQFLSMGYFLESSARVARSGRWRDGFIGVRKAARIGGVFVGAGLALVPYALVSSYTRSASLIDPDGRVERLWRTGLAVIAILTFLHLVAASIRGARIRHYLWPVGSAIWWIRLRKQRGVYARSRDDFWSFLKSFRWNQYFKVGLIGYVGSFVWLAPPAFLISQGGKFPLVGAIGTLWLLIVVPFLPFLQVRYAVEDRWRALFEVRAVRGQYRRAPWAFAFALLVLLAASIPLYLVKIETVPREAAWLPGLFFVSFLAPAHILTGWAYSRAGRREKQRHWSFRIIGRLAIVPAALLYVLVVLLAQYTTWGGSATLYQQHAFLLPAAALQP
jgi:hypothetical protein